jgi:quinol-cytochrome oxidoreductase complex cytochrome b subunit
MSLKLDKDKKFYPDYLFEILVVCLVVLEVVLALSYLFAPRTGRPVDFSRNFMPLPEWYFLSLYQLLKYFPGKSAFIGVVVIPCAALYFMFALPFMEKTKSRRLRDRLPSASVAAFLLFATIALTILAYL